MAAKASKPAGAVAAGRRIGRCERRFSKPMRLCNVSTRRVLLIAMAIGCAARARAQPKMWEFEVLMRDSGMSCVFAGYSSKKRDGW